MNISPIFTNSLAAKYYLLQPKMTQMRVAKTVNLCVVKTKTMSQKPLKSSIELTRTARSPYE